MVARTTPQNRCRVHISSIYGSIGSASVAAGTVPGRRTTAAPRTGESTAAPGTYHAMLEPRPR